MKRRDFLRNTMTMSLAIALRPASGLERYPQRPIHLMVPSAPGGVHDVIGRLWAEGVRPQLGTIVIDNRGGGGGAQTTFAILAPAGTPTSIVAQIDAATQKVMADPAFRARPLAIGFEPVPALGPVPSEQLFREETARSLPIVKAIAPE